ncbi:MAG: putative porin [Psychroflexus sp.]|nr:putative porin [Psychroflexus sp.]MDN6309865.1 putative porin [Psychroflexus sp.]
MRLVLIISIFFFALSASAQRKLTGTPTNRPSITLDDEEESDDDSEKKDIKEVETEVSSYKIITMANDTTYVDTTLTIQKNYKYNYLRRDDFGLLGFQNIGQTFNRLTYDFDKLSNSPQFGARARHFNFMEAEDINYYDVPTPFTELYFRTVFEQGQNVDAFFTSNIKPNFNLSIAYKGLRSLGSYQNTLTSTGNLRLTLNFNTKNKRYYAKTHFVAQDLMNQENGGLTAEGERLYINKIPEYDERSSVAVHYQNAENQLDGKRFYLDHFYKLKAADSTSKYELRVNHSINFSDKEYRFTQKEATDIYGETYENKDLFNEVEYQYVKNKFGASYLQPDLGVLEGFIEHTNYNYGFKSIVLQNEQTIPNRIKEDVVSVGGKYANDIAGIQLKANAVYNLSDTFEGYDLKASASYQIDSLNLAQAELKLNSARPNFNTMLFQSDYKNYNWYNPDFSNIKTQSLSVLFNSQTFGSYKASLTQINNHTHFGLIDNPDASSSVDSLVKPMQSNAQVQYFKLQASKDFDFGSFALANDVIYQNVMSGESAFHVPEFVTRQSFYYKDYWFNKALYLQTGFTFNYFTDYKSDGYDPVLAEFFVLDENFKNFYTLDFFFNAKVRTARIFFKLENFTTLLEGNNNFAAPRHPYRDFAIRFGIVWNFFM